MATPAPKYANPSPPATVRICGLSTFTPIGQSTLPIELSTSGLPVALMTSRAPGLSPVLLLQIVLPPPINDRLPLLKASWFAEESTGMLPF